MPTKCWLHNRMVEKNLGPMQKKTRTKRVLSRPPVVDDLACYAQVDGGCRRLTLGGVATEPRRVPAGGELHNHHHGWGLHPPVQPGAAQL